MRSPLELASGRERLSGLLDYGAIYLHNSQWVVCYLSNIFYIYILESGFFLPILKIFCFVPILILIVVKHIKQHLQNHVLNLQNEIFNLLDR